MPSVLHFPGTGLFPPGPYSRTALKNRARHVGLATILVVCLAACLTGTLPALAADPLPGDGVAPITPLPLTVEVDSAKVALGERLFHDRRLSADGSMSCASCHDPALGGADGKPRSLRPGGTPTAVNTPTLFNAEFNSRLSWDGRAANLEEQGRDHLVELGSDWTQAQARLAGDADYVATFRRVYPDGPTAVNLQDALVQFERSLITPNAPFDRYLRGQADAISPRAAQGYALFNRYGCSACHQGVNIGGNMFQKVGVMGNYFDKRGHVTTPDLGRFNVTGRERDRYMFRVPSLRNVELTAPYLHDGELKALKDTVKGMSKFMLGRPIPDGDIELIVEFLRTLTGEYQGKPL